MQASIHEVRQHWSSVPGIAAMSLLTDRSFPRHAHDQFGIGIILMGAQRSWSGIGPVEARAGDIISANPGEVHDGHPVSGAARRWRMLYLDPGLVTAAMAEETPGRFEITRPAMHDPVLAARFAHLFASLTDREGESLACEEALACTLEHVARHHGSAKIALPRAVPAVARALARLDAAPERAPTLAELAALSGISRFQLLRAFAKEVGVTPHAYLVQRRVRLAQRRLTEGRRVVEAAALAGFSDQSHLTRCFVRQLGITPARYRAAFQKMGRKTPIRNLAPAASRLDGRWFVLPDGLPS